MFTKWENVLRTILFKLQMWEEVSRIKQNLSDIPVVKGKKQDFFKLRTQHFNWQLSIDTKLEYYIFKTIPLELQIWVEVSELIKQNINYFPVVRRRKMDFFRLRTQHFYLHIFNGNMFTKLECEIMKIILLELQI